MKGVATQQPSNGDIRYTYIENRTKYVVLAVGYSLRTLRRLLVCVW